MLKIEKNKSLAPYTTLKIGAKAKFFAVIKSREDLQQAISWAQINKQNIWILGGGSNVLISRNIPALVLKNELTGFDILEKNLDSALVQAYSGESWTKFVNFTINQQLYGLENLFLIYGTVGAAPIQNIGAYGVELKDIFHHLTAIDLKTGKEKIFSIADCQFAYRDSIFKHKLKNRYFIYSLVVKLKYQAELKLNYGSIKQELLKQGITQPSLAQLVVAIARIRNSKLPNPALWPNAGSFFKNAVISSKQFKAITKKYSEVPYFSSPSGKIKIPTAWLIEQVGFKGKRIGPVGMHDKQALILVNYGGASARQVLNLVKQIKIQVKENFGIKLQEEVNII